MQSFIGWIGGKRALRRDTLAAFPQEYSRYIEVFGGAGWVLFGKQQSGQIEVFNDADGSLINIYRCIKYHPDALAEELSGLPHSREMFFDFQNQFEQRGYTDIQRAARSLYLIKMSFGSDRRTFATAPKIASNISSSFSEVQDRLRKVIIEHLDFEQLIHIYDRPSALFTVTHPTWVQNTTIEPGSLTRTMSVWPVYCIASRESFCYRIMTATLPAIYMRIALSNP